MGLSWRKRPPRACPGKLYLVSMPFLLSSTAQLCAPDMLILLCLPRAVELPSGTATCDTMNSKRTFPSLPCFFGLFFTTTKSLARGFTQARVAQGITVVSGDYRLTSHSSSAFQNSRRGGGDTTPLRTTHSVNARWLHRSGPSSVGSWSPGTCQKEASSYFPICKHFFDPCMAVASK